MFWRLVCACVCQQILTKTAIFGYWCVYIPLQPDWKMISLNCPINVFSYQVMQALVQHYSQHGWLERVEQCVLHMDIASLDFNQVHFSPYDLRLGGRPIP